MRATGKKLVPSLLEVLPCLLVALFWSRPGEAHTPVTTKILFNREVVRIFQRNCLGCHRPGGIAPMSLATYEEARPWAKAIKDELLEKGMPPWHAIKGFGDFRNAPLLTQREIELVVNWVEGGVPKGDPKELPPEPLFSAGWSLGEPDLLLEPESGQAVAADADVERSFVLSTRLKSERWVTAVDLQPGEASVVHCAEFYLDGKQPSLLGTWVPGYRVAPLPDGVARRLGPGSRVIVRIHYRGSGQALVDRSKLGFYFARSRPTRELREALIAGPAPGSLSGGGPHRARASFRLETDAEAVALTPRADPGVASLEATAYRPDGTAEVLIWARGGRFGWRPTYVLKKPVKLSRGTRLEVTAYIDPAKADLKGDRAPNQEASFEGAQAPLCVLFYTPERTR